MNPILNDPLVVRYFWWCNADHDHSEHGCRESMALRVLDAMCAPLKDGQRILLLNPGRNAREQEAVNDFPEQIHAMILAIPSEHQEPDYEKELERRLGGDALGWKVFEREWIKEFVDLARKAERQKMEKERR